MDKHSGNLSVDELLKALEQTSDETEVITTDPVFSFIQTFGIQEGKCKIMGHLIYDLFRHWNKRNKITAYLFHQQFQKYFTLTRGSLSLQKHYYLNQSIKDLITHIEKHKKPDSSTRVKGKTVQKHFTNFLNTYDIKRGHLYIESDVFYHIYDTWTYRNKKKNCLSYARFINICHLFFESKTFKGSDLVWFGVDPNIKQHISTQAVSNWRQGRSKRGKKSKVDQEDQEKIIYPETQTD